MKKGIILLGVFLIILAFLFYIVIPFVSSTRRVGGNITVHPGDYYIKAHSLGKDVDIRGNINEVTGGLGHIDFYVFDDYNYYLWADGQSYSKYVFIYKAGTGSTFSFRTDKADVYCFVFDHPGGLFEVDRNIDWSASYEYKPFAPYAIPIALVLGGLGVVVLAIGLLAKPKQVVPPPTMQKD